MAMEFTAVFYSGELYSITCTQNDSTVIVKGLLFEMTITDDHARIAFEPIAADSYRQTVISPKMDKASSFRDNIIQILSIIALEHNCIRLTIVASDLRKMGFIPDYILDIGYDTLDMAVQRGNTWLETAEATHSVLHYYNGQSSRLFDPPNQLWITFDRTNRFKTQQMPFHTILRENMYSIYQGQTVKKRSFEDTLDKEYFLYYNENDDEERQY